MFDLALEKTGSEESWASGGHVTIQSLLIYHHGPEIVLRPSVLALVYQLAICPPVSPIYTAKWVFDVLYTNICINSGPEFVFELLPPVVHQRSRTLVLRLSLYYWDYPAQLSELTAEGFSYYTWCRDHWPGLWQASYYGTRWYIRDKERKPETICFHFIPLLTLFGLGLFREPLHIWVSPLFCGFRPAEVSQPPQRPRPELPLIFAGDRTGGHPQHWQISDLVPHPCYWTLLTAEARPRSGLAGKEATCDNLISMHKLLNSWPTFRYKFCCPLGTSGGATGG